MLLQFPAPKSWEEFEFICLQLWRDVWGDPNAQRVGRNGQDQDGVDIFGSPIRGKGIYGVQCKLKDALVAAAISEQDLTQCVDAARDFKPALKHFTVATTGPRDEKIQETARKQSADPNAPFQLSVWSWHDISEELSYRDKVASGLYRNPSLQSPPEENLGQISRLDPSDKLFAIISRPAFRSQLPAKLLQEAGKLLFEIVDNTFSHGAASRVSISIENGCISLRDDGFAFDPTANVKTEIKSFKDGVGLWAIGRFLKKYENRAELKWREVVDSSALRRGHPGNEITLQFSADTIQSAKNDAPDLEVGFMLGGMEISRIASEINISSNAETFHLQFTEGGALSPEVMLVEAIRKRLPPSTTLIVSARADDDILHVIQSIGDPRVVVGPILPG
ncbi:MAG TPA: hypothetical protein VIM61_07715 [Chthoniobacterales bacterium]|jgi:hypothetical protein